MSQFSRTSMIGIAAAATMVAGLSVAQAQPDPIKAPAERARERIAALKEEAMVEKQVIASPGSIRFTAHKIGKEESGHRGEFQSWHYSKVVLPEGEEIVGGEIVAHIDITSLKTDVDKLTAHLLSPDFFTSEKFPRATLTVTNARRNTAEDAAAPYIADGVLLLAGVQQPISLHFDVTNRTPLKVKGFATVNRQHHKVGAGKYTEEASTIVDRIPVQFEVIVDPAMVMATTPAEPPVEPAPKAE